MSLNVKKFNTLFTVICPYNHKSKWKEEEHYLSVADDTGVIRLMLLPKHLYASSDQAVKFQILLLNISVLYYRLNMPATFAICM